ncbi:MAG: hypothetical protein HGB19_01915, partial [Chlorobiales bacterium]|nr:hypothetical protein [Chlorobiales bacterium]
SIDTIIDIQDIETAYPKRIREIPVMGFLGKFNSYLLGELLSSLAKSLKSNKEISPKIQIKYNIESNGTEISFSIIYKNEKKDNIINELISNLKLAKKQEKDILLDKIKVWSVSERDNITYYQNIATVAGATLSTQDNTTEGFIRITEPPLIVCKG